MGQAEYRRRQKAARKKEKIYTLTQAQIDGLKEEAVEEALRQAEKRIDKAKESVTEEAVGKALALTLVLPLEVLITDYWPKTAHKRGPEFVAKVLDLYERWENDEVSMNDLLDDLWEYGHVRIEYKEADANE